MLVTEPDRYTVEQLTMKLADQYHLDPADCRYALDELLNTGFIKIGDDAKVSLKRCSRQSDIAAARS